MSRYSVIKEALKGETRSIQIGRSFNRSGYGSRTPVDVVPGNAAPELKGQPYLKTHFQNGAFSKTLYTPSTLRVTVGADWLKARGC